MSPELSATQVSMTREDLQYFLDGAVRLSSSLQTIIETIEPMNVILNQIVRRQHNDQGHIASVATAQHCRPIAKEATSLTASFEAAASSMKMQEYKAEAAIRERDTYSALHATNELYDIFMKIYPKVARFNGYVDKIACKAKATVQSETERLGFEAVLARWKEVVEQWLKETAMPAWEVERAEVTETGTAREDATEGVERRGGL